MTTKPTVHEMIAGELDTEAEFEGRSASNVRASGQVPCIWLWGHGFVGGEAAREDQD